MISSELNLSSLGTNGFILNGIDAGDNSGVSSSASDVNDDAIAVDIILGARFANSNVNISAGESYGGFENKTGFDAASDASN